MFQGELVGIYVAPKKTAMLEGMAQVEAVAGRGLAGDRYFRRDGTFSATDGPDREVTLIEREALEALRRDHGISLKDGESRRNLITRGVPLNHLVGVTFRVGAVVLRGLRLCEPCGHLERLTRKGVESGLAHRGGLRAQILQGGVLQIGAAIAPVATAEAADAR